MRGKTRGRVVAVVSWIDFDDIESDGLRMTSKCRGYLEELVAREPVGEWCRNAWRLGGTNTIDIERSIDPADAGCRGLQSGIDLLMHTIGADLVECDDPCSALAQPAHMCLGVDIRL